jgi:predicted alpha/beta hydrolase family esterase
MKKVFIVHGFGGMPNGGWRSWLMGELDKKGIWAAALPITIPDPEAPVCTEWVRQLQQYVEDSKNDEIYLVGHSLGATTILRYLQMISDNTAITFPGIVLVSGPIESLDRPALENFLDKPFDFEMIKTKAKQFAVIHGDDDQRVPLRHGEKLSKELGVELIVVPNGGHLNGKSGWHTLPQCLDALTTMIN